METNKSRRAQFSDSIKWSTVYFLDKINGRLIIRDGSGNIDYRQFNSEGYVNWSETQLAAEMVQEHYDDDEVLYEEVNAGILTMSYDCPYKVEQVSPYREFINF